MDYYTKKIEIYNDVETYQEGHMYWQPYVKELECLVKRMKKKKDGDWEADEKDYQNWKLGYLLGITGEHGRNTL